MLERTKNLVLAATIPFILGSCETIASLTFKEIVGTLAVGYVSVGIATYNPPSELEAYAIELYKRDFGDKEKFPKGYGKYPIGTTYQYRGDICILLNSNDSGEIWWPIFRLAREKMGEEKYNLRKQRDPLRGGIDFYQARELTQICMEIDSNSVNGNNDGVSHPKEVKARLKQVFPGATRESLN